MAKIADKILSLSSSAPNQYSAQRQLSEKSQELQMDEGLKSAYYALCRSARKNSRIEEYYSKEQWKAVLLETLVENLSDKEIAAALQKDSPENMILLDLGKGNSSGIDTKNALNIAGTSSAQTSTATLLEQAAIAVSALPLPEEKGDKSETPAEDPSKIIAASFYMNIISPALYSAVKSAESPMDLKLLAYSSACIKEMGSNVSSLLKEIEFYNSPLALANDIKEICSISIVYNEAEKAVSEEKKMLEKEKESLSCAENNHQEYASRKGIFRQIAQDAFSISQKSRYAVSNAEKMGQCTELFSSQKVREALSLDSKKHLDIAASTAGEALLLADKYLISGEEKSISAFENSKAGFEHEIASENPELQKIRNFLASANSAAEEREEILSAKAMIGTLIKEPGEEKKDFTSYSNEIREFLKTANARITKTENVISEKAAIEKIKNSLKEEEKNLNKALAKSHGETLECIIRTEPMLSVTAGMIVGENDEAKKAREELAFLYSHITERFAFGIETLFKENSALLEKVKAEYNKRTLNLEENIEKCDEFLSLIDKIKKEYSGLMALSLSPEYVQRGIKNSESTISDAEKALNNSKRNYSTIAEKVQKAKDEQAIAEIILNNPSAFLCEEKAYAYILDAAANIKEIMSYSNSRDDEEKKYLEAAGLSSAISNYSEMKTKVEAIARENIDKLPDEIKAHKERIENANAVNCLFSGGIYKVKSAEAEKMKSAILMLKHSVGVCDAFYGRIPNKNIYKQ